MTVRELIEELQKYPDDMKVVDGVYDDIKYVYENSWVHNYYPESNDLNEHVVVIY